MKIHVIMSYYDFDIVYYYIYGKVMGELPPLQEIMDYLHSLSSDYIWQREPMKLEEKSLPEVHYCGLLHFDDHLDDEKMVVNLLLKVTVRFPNVLVRLVELDSELLFTLLADKIPSWITERNAPNRVFLSNGEVMLIPQGKTVTDVVDIPDDVIPLTTALDVVRRFPSICRTSVAYRNQLVTEVQLQQKNEHFANCMLPKVLAAALRVNPQLVSDAVHAYHSQRVAPRTIKYPPVDLVKQPVRFSKCLYAMLLYGSNPLFDSNNWPFPKVAGNLYKAYNLGWKLTCGFELLDTVISVEQDVLEQEPIERPDDNENWLVISANEASLDGEPNYLAKSLKQFMKKKSSMHGVKVEKNGLHLKPGLYANRLKRVLDLSEDEDESDSETVDDSSMSGDELDDDEKMDVSTSCKEMQSLMDDMDRELAMTDVGRSFENAMQDSEVEGSSGTIPKVNVERNLIDNFYQSYYSAGGNTGAAATILHSMNVNMIPPTQNDYNLDSDDALN
ncbi:Protein SGT1 -like protein [Trichinella papuae]|uniref:Protein SGT1-like protein n=1 Tax=Trichinella papuae TaxID=268474 RepID=A0A0V1MKJ5_9BILA|nr:Protein SGT1 -like protein [Trichinella papuae]